MRQYSKMCVYVYTYTYIDLLYANYLSEDKLLFAKLTSLKCAQAGKSALVLFNCLNKPMHKETSFMFELKVKALPKQTAQKVHKLEF